MLTEVTVLLETAAIAISGLLVKKYVFLEPDIEQKTTYILRNKRIAY